MGSVAPLGPCQALHAELCGTHIINRAIIAENSTINGGSDPSNFAAKGRIESPGGALGLAMQRRSLASNSSVALTANV